MTYTRIFDFGKPPAVQRSTDSMMPPESASHVASGERGPVFSDQGPL